MTRWALVATLAALVGLGAYAWHLDRGKAALALDNARQARSITALEGARDQARLAADVAAARAAWATQMTIEANATIDAIRNLQLGECADAQIDPDLAAILGRRDVQPEN